MEYVFLEEESGQRISLEPLSAETAEDCGHRYVFKGPGSPEPPFSFARFTASIFTRKSMEFPRLLRRLGTRWG